MGLKPMCGPVDPCSLLFPQASGCSARLVCMSSHNALEWQPQNHYPRLYMAPYYWGMTLQKLHRSVPRHQYAARDLHALHAHQLRDFFARR